MRCLTCQYSLSNLHSRTCPECGSGFKPSDFQFVPGTVAFCCPHCDQDYYGTTHHGHLLPEKFDCVKCGVHIQMDEMVMRPAEGLEAEDTEAHHVPWAQRTEIGWFKAFGKTLGMAIARPSEIGLGRIQKSDTREALRFATYSLLLVAFVSVLTQVVIQIAMLGTIGTVTTTMPGGGGIVAPPPPGASVYLGMFSGQLLAGLIAIPIGLIILWIWALTAHAILKIGNASKYPAFATKRAFYYAAGANVMSLVPCLGWLLGGPWATVCTIQAVRSTHRVGLGRAMLAVLPLPLLSIGGSVALFVYMISTTLSAMNTKVVISTFNPNTEQLTQALIRWSNNNDQFPPHIVALIADNTVPVGDLIRTNSHTQYGDLVIGTFNVDATDNLTEPLRTQQFKVYLDNLPPDILAYRLGDFVFYPSRYSPTQTEPSRWLVVAWPDPDTNPPLNPNELVEIGLADGTTIYHLNAVFQSMLDAENKARSDADLPAIPHPKDVTHKALVLEE